MAAEAVSSMVASGDLNVEVDLCWKTGMDEWKTLAQCGFAGSSELTDSPVASSAGVNPYAVSPATIDTSRSLAPAVKHGGFGRALFAAACIGTLVVTGSVEELIPDLSNLAVVLMFGGLLFATLRRLKNLGMSGWGVLYFIVPIVSYWLTWRLWACPEGYDAHKTLDTAGKVVTACIIGIPLLLIAVAMSSWRIH